MKFYFSSWLLSLSFFVFSSVLAASAVEVADTMEQRLASCAACHGEYGQGNLNDPKIPRLAEKPAGYLYKQLKSIQAGEGTSLAMEHLIRPLSNAYLQKIAVYYSSQTVVNHPQPVNVSAEVMARGEQLAKEGDMARGVPACQRCHGEALTGVGQMIPSILNQPYDYIYTQLELWNQGRRSIKSTHCMWVVAKRIIKSDMEAVSAYLASQPLPEIRTPISMDELPEPLPGWCTVEESGVNL